MTQMTQKNRHAGGAGERMKDECQVVPSLPAMTRRSRVIVRSARSARAERFLTGTERSEARRVRSCGPNPMGYPPPDRTQCGAILRTEPNAVPPPADRTQCGAIPRTEPNGVPSLRTEPNAVRSCGPKPMGCDPTKRTQCGAILWTEAILEGSSRAIECPVPHSAVYIDLPIFP